MRTRLALTLALSALPVALTGCSLDSTSTNPVGAGAAIQGSVHGGQQPIVGSHVYLLAANTNGYGSASTSLLNAALTGNSDSVGAYVTTGQYGNFNITGDYTCPAGSQVYLYALGGNPGAGVNTAAAEMVILGSCPAAGTFAGSVPFLQVNEVTTVAAAYAMAGFATDATHVSSSGTTQALKGISNAFANAGNLASIASGGALTTTPAGNGTVPTTTLNTLANILAACINSPMATSPSCNTLLGNTKTQPNGSSPTDTASAAINMAHYPSTNVATLVGLSTPTAPFQPSLTKTPNDLSVGINFSGGGLNYPTTVAIDANGNAWTGNNNVGSVSEFSPLGAALSGTNGFTGGGLNQPNAVAIDALGNLWAANGVGSVSELNSSGAPLSPAPNGYVGGGLNLNTAPQFIALDGSGNAFTSNFNNTVSKFSSNGTPATNSPITGGGLNTPVGIAIDQVGAVWVSDQSGNAVSRFSNAGTAISPVAGYQGSGAGPDAIAIDSGGNAITTDGSGNSVSKFLNNGNLYYTVQGNGINNPVAVIADGQMNTWIANLGTNSVMKLSSAGTVMNSVTGITGGGINGPMGIAVDPSGNLWVPNVGNNTMTELIGIAAPTVTPLALGVKNSTLGLRP